jgi:hypothetical protein
MKITDRQKLVLSIKYRNSRPCIIKTKGMIQKVKKRVWAFPWRLFGKCPEKISNIDPIKIESNWFLQVLKDGRECNSQTGCVIIFEKEGTVKILFSNKNMFGLDGT